MTTTTPVTRPDTRSRTRSERLSPDGKWRSFPRVPNLLQYVSTGLYFARVKVNGKLIRRGLDTTVFETAKLKLHDFIKAAHGEQETAKAGTVGAALRIYLRSIKAQTDLTESTRKYYRDCVRALLKSWPGIRLLPLEKLTLERTIGEAYKGDAAFQRCEKWSIKLRDEIDAQYFNNVLSRLRQVLEIGGVPREKNPAWKIKRETIDIVPPTLPTLEQFQKIVAEMETSGARQSQYCADFARFLAFSGCRLGEAKAVTWAAVRGDALVIEKNKRRKGKVIVVTKTVPIIKKMRELLERIRPKDAKPEDRILKVGECEKSLARACGIVGVPVLTHHDLRHLFATVCIESGVPIQTVSRWLGHSDGGALAMRTYGHLRDEHSAAMAQKVTF